MTEACKWEKLRRVRYGDLLRLFRHRWGRTLPEGDDGAREDFFELMQLISLAPAGSEEKMANAIEIWTPWMPEWEAENISSTSTACRNTSGLEQQGSWERC